MHETAASGASAELELTPPEVVSSNEGGRVSAICINQQAVPVRAGGATSQESLGGEFWDYSVWLVVYQAGAEN